MKIIIEKPQDKQLVLGLCDVALKVEGLKNLECVKEVLGSIVEAEVPKDK